MARKRIKLTRHQYDELKEALMWAKRTGREGFARWYEEELAFQARRRALPEGAIEYAAIEEERPRGRF